MRGGGQTDERTNERTKVPCVLQDIVPFGAAAQKGQYDPASSVPLGLRIFHLYLSFIFKERWKHMKNFHLGPKNFDLY